MIMHRFVFIKSICYGYFLSKLSVTLVHLFYIYRLHLPIYFIYVSGHDLYYGHSIIMIEKWR